MSVNFLVGDCLKTLATIPENSIDCIVTSPPYFNLRDYGIKGQIGLESTLELYVEKMVDVCWELRRILKPTGTFWLNIGDTYVNSSTGGGLPHHFNARTKMNRPKGPRLTGLKPKDLCMVPNHLAIALQKDGWYVRSEIIWHRPNPMPASLHDRPTCAHEKVWLLTKRSKYFYDGEAITERAVTAGKVASSVEQSFERQRHDETRDKPYVSPNAKVVLVGETKNARNVWTIPVVGYQGAHFATMPTALAARCIKAGCPKGGRVLDPFGGAGTTGLVADRLGRHCTLLELNPKYVEIAKQRISEDRKNRRLRKNPMYRPVHNKPNRSFLSTFRPKRSSK